jgi:dienelactone hydrolase
VNNQIQADRFASEGFVVIMPDLFHGDPAPNSRTAASQEAVAEQSSSLLDTFKIKAAETAKSFLIDMWLARHTEEKVLPILRKVLEASREEFADAVASGGGIFAVGYCFGGRYVLLLGSAKPAETVTVSKEGESTAEGEEPEPAVTASTSPPLIKAGALAHPTMVSSSDFQYLMAPTSVVCVENDPMFPDEMRNALEDHLPKIGVQHQVQVYPGVPHGRCLPWTLTVQSSRKLR